MSIFIKIIDTKDKPVYLNTRYIQNFSANPENDPYKTTLYTTIGIVHTSTTVDEILNMIKSAK